MWRLLSVADGSIFNLGPRLSMISKERSSREEYDVRVDRSNYKQKNRLLDINWRYKMRNSLRSMGQKYLREERERDLELFNENLDYARYLFCKNNDILVEWR